MPNGDRPRVSATRGFALSGSGRGGRRQPSRARRRRAARPGARAATRLAPRRTAGPGQRVNLRLDLRDRLGPCSPRRRGRRLRPSPRRCSGRSCATCASRSRAIPIPSARGPSNVALSQRRAQSVADFLASTGVERDRLAVRGYGPDRPLPGHCAPAPARTGGSRPSGSTRPAAPASSAATESASSIACAGLRRGSQWV